MKNILRYILLTVLAGGLFASCDVNDDFDNFDELTKKQIVISKTLDMTPEMYTKLVGLLDKEADADAITFLKANNAFSAKYPADKYAVPLVADLYPEVDPPSSITLNYTYLGEQGGEAAKYYGKSHTVTAEEYDGVWGVKNAAESFAPSKMPADHMPAILKSAYEDAKEGEVKNVNYFYSQEEPESVAVQGEIFLSEDFEVAKDEIFDTWQNVMMISERGWQHRDYDNNWYLQISSFGSKTKDDTYMVTPKIKLDDVDGLYISFDLKTRFFNEPCLSVLVSTDYNGDGTKEGVAAATWTDVSDNFDKPMDTDTEDQFITMGFGDIDEFRGQEIYVALRYQGNNSSEGVSATTTYQIDNFSVFQSTSGFDVAEKELVYAAYQFDGEKWAEYSGRFVLLLQPEQYTEELNERNPYIRENTAKQKLPVWLDSEYPFDLEGYSHTIVFYTDATTVMGLEFIKENGVWKTQDFKSSQFVKTAKDGWVFDPTLHVDFGGNTDAFQDIVDYVAAHEGVDNPDVLDSRGNAEFYYGFNAYYTNVTYRDKDRATDPTFPSSGTKEEKAKFMDKRTYEGLIIYLNTTYSGLTPEVSGVKQMAEVRNVKIFSNPTATLENEHFTYVFQYVKAGKWMVISRQSLEQEDNFTQYNELEK